MEEWLINNSILLDFIKSIAFVILGGLLKAVWDIFTFHRNEKMFYSNEFLKLQVNKINDLIEKLADYHKNLIDVQFGICDKKANIDIREITKKLISSLANIDKSIAELGFFIADNRHNALRNNINSISDSIKDIIPLLCIIKVSGYTEENKENLKVLIYDLDLMLYSVKRNLKSIIPEEYTFIKNGKFAKFVANKNRPNMNEYKEQLNQAILHQRYNEDRKISTNQEQQ